MKRHLPILALLAVLSSAAALAGDPGYVRHVPRGGHVCADSKFQTPRYNQILPYRHHGDYRRYNAAPCCGETLRTEPYLLKTIVVSKLRVPPYTYDAYGNRRCRRVLTTTYKALYSDGSCHVWTVQG